MVSFLKHLFKTPLCIYILVCFHAADKDIAKTGQFTKERGLMDLQFHMAGEASQSWHKVKEEQRNVLHGSRQESMCRGTALYKTVRSHETYSLPWEQYGRNHPHDSIISHQAPSMTHQDYGNNSRWDLGGDTVKPYHKSEDQKLFPK